MSENCFTTWHIHIKFAILSIQIPFFICPFFHVIYPFKMEKITITSRRGKATGRNQG